MRPGLRPALAERLADARARLDRLEPGDTFDPRVPAAIVSAGLHLLPVPAAAGGLGGSMAEAAAVLTALGAVDGSLALGFAMHVHAAGSIADSAMWPAATRERLYRAIVEDGALVNNAATEEGGGSPARGAIPGTIARPDPSGDGWRLTGEKTWTTWLPALRFAFVSARFANESPAVLGSFLVDLDGAGIERRTGFEAMGMRASASGRLALDGAHVPSDGLVSRRPATEPDPRGPAPGAWFAMAVAATYLGVGEGARTAVARWARERRPGDGSRSVADVPTVQLRLGRLDAALRTARIVLFEATRRWDEAGAAGSAQGAGGTGPGNSARAALLPDLALAKITATNAAVQATDEAMRICGGPGFLAGPLERAFRDARAGLINPPLDDIALTGFGRALLEGDQ